LPGNPDVVTFPIRLVEVAGLEQNLKQVANLNQQFQTFWQTAKDWSEEARYQNWSLMEARGLYIAVTDSRSGVLQWVKRYW
jgi:hypothetical protein